MTRRHSRQNLDGCDARAAIPASLYSVLKVVESTCLTSEPSTLVFTSTSSFLADKVDPQTKVYPVLSTSTVNYWQYDYGSERYTSVAEVAYLAHDAPALQTES